MSLEYFLRTYLRERPLFLSLIRAKEAYLFQKYLPFKKPVLDVGCGDGFFTNVTFAKNFQFPRPTSHGRSPGGRAISNFQLDAGLDLQDSRIEEARKLNIYKKLVIYNGKKIPLPDNSFNTVVSNCVLEHVEDVETVLTEIYRVLRPGGVFITTVMARPWEEHLFGTRIFGSFYKKWMRKKQVHLNLFTCQKWNQVFQKAGFQREICEGYLSPQSCALIDICHYLSFPSLISYTFLGKWMLFPQITSYLYPTSHLAKVLLQKVSREDSGALFYVLKK